MRIYLQYLCLFFVLNGFSQRTLSTVKIKLKTINSENPIAFVDNSRNKHFLIEEGIDNTYFIINANGKLEHQGAYKKPNDPFKVLQGYSFDDNNTLSLYYSNYNANAFLEMRYYKNKTEVVKQHILNFEKDERFLTAINYANQFSFITFQKNSSTLKLYEFDNSKVSSKKYDLNNDVFLDSNLLRKNLGDILNPKEVAFINPNETPSLGATSKKIKIYVESDFIRVTLDHRSDGTRLINLSKSSTDTQSLFFEINRNDLQDEKVNQSNSFYLRKRLIQVCLTKNHIMLSNFRTDSLTLLSLSHGDKSDGIKFKNSPFYFQSKGMEEIEKTEAFLRKLNNADLGVWGMIEKDKMKLEIGGSNYNKTFVFAPGANFTFFTVQNGRMIALPGTSYYYQGLKDNILFFQSQFNFQTGEHIDGPYLKNAIEKASTKVRYLKNSVLKNKLKLETIFKGPNGYILGYYNKKDKEFTLINFED